MGCYLLAKRRWRAHGIVCTCHYDGGKSLSCRGRGFLIHFFFFLELFSLSFLVALSFIVLFKTFNKIIFLKNPSDFFSQGARAMKRRANQVPKGSFHKLQMWEGELVYPNTSTWARQLLKPLPSRFKMQMSQQLHRSTKSGWTLIILTHLR